MTVAFAQAQSHVALLSVKHMLGGTAEGT